MEKTIKFNGPAQTLYAYIAGLVKNSSGLPGERLPSERALALRFNLARTTARKVISSFVEDGVLYRIQGKGTFIREKNRGRFDLGFLNSSGSRGLSSILKSQGFRISNRVLKVGSFSGQKYFSSRLSINASDTIFGLHRIRYANGQPFALEYTYTPLKYYPGIKDIDFSLVSLYDYFVSCGRRMETGLQSIRTLDAGGKEAKYLDVDKGATVYYAEFTGRDESGIVIEYTESHIRIDKTQFHFRTGQ